MKKSIEEAWTEARARALEAAEAAAATFTGLRCHVETLVRDGHPLDVLIRVANEQNADVIVVGPHGKGTLEMIFLGSVSEGLLQAMPAAVAVARSPFRTPAKVILATDGSPASAAAVRFLARFPLPEHAHIKVLHVVCELIGINPCDDAAVAAQIIDNAVAVFDAAGRDTSIEIRHGDAKREILAVAADDDADLVVTGARGLGGFEGLVLGSVSRAVAKAAKCSVLIVDQEAGPTG